MCDSGPNAPVSIRYAMQYTPDMFQPPGSLPKSLNWQNTLHVGRQQCKQAILKVGTLKQVTVALGTLVYSFVVKLLTSTFFKLCFLSFNTAFLPPTATYRSALRTSVWKILASFILDLFFRLTAREEGQSVVALSKNKNRRIPPRNSK